MFISISGMKAAVLSLTIAMTICPPAAFSAPPGHFSPLPAEDFPVCTEVIGDKSELGLAPAPSSVPLPEPPDVFLCPQAMAEALPESSLLAQRLNFEQESISPQPGEIDVFSKQIMQKELELLRLNTRFRAESTKTGKWKPWRQFAYALAGNTVINIGIDHIAFARWKYWQRPTLASKPFLRKGPLCLLIGHSIIASGVILESALDCINDRKVKKKGFDRKTCRERVIVLRNEIDHLLTRRAQTVATTGGREKELLEQEGKVLTDVRNCALDEYANLSARAAKWKAARITSNAMIFGNATTGGYIGSLGNLLAVMNRKPRLALPAGVGFIVSGAFIVMTAPTTKILSTVVAKHEGKKERNLLGGVPVDAPAQFDKNRTVLSAMLNEYSGSLADSVRDRANIYKLQNDIFDAHAALSKKEARVANKEFVEKMIVGAATGGTKIAWGTNLVVAGSAWSNTAPARAVTVPVRFGGRTFRAPVRPPKTPAQMFSRRVAQGATCQVAGSSIGILDVLQSRVRGEMRANNAKKSGTGPGHFIANRMKILDEMEQKLK